MNDNSAYVNKTLEKNFEKLAEKITYFTSIKIFWNNLFCILLNKHLMQYDYQAALSIKDKPRQQVEWAFFQSVTQFRVCQYKFILSTCLINKAGDIRTKIATEVSEIMYLANPGFW